MQKIEIRADEQDRYMIRSPEQGLKAGEAVVATFEVTDEQAALILGNKIMRLALVTLLDVFLARGVNADHVAGILTSFTGAARKMAES